MASLPSGARVVVLAGPGVAGAGPRGVDGLRALAHQAGLGVLNTWGLKGVFDWESPHHLGTVGLQERDFEMAGLAEAGLIVATGLDAHESPPERWQLAPHALAAPRQLAELARRWPLPAAVPERPLLYRRLADIVQPLFASDRVPLSPARAVADVKAALPPGGVVFADAGLAGFWTARAFPTSELGGVVVPAVGEAGFAAWNAVHAARLGRAAIAITRDPYDLATEEALAYAATSGVAFVLCVWGAGSLSSADDHRERLAAALSSGRPRVVEVPVDWADTDLLLALAGPIIAWGPSS